MKWNHLPVAGGLYDQHPKLLEDFRYIFAARNAHEAEKEQKRKQEQDRNKRNQSRSPGRASRPRR